MKERKEGRKDRHEKIDKIDSNLMFTHLAGFTKGSAVAEWTRALSVGSVEPRRGDSNPQ